jgi:signal transduction histidine kinase
MSIRTKLSLSAAITTGLALVVALTVSLQFKNVGQAARTERFAFGVIKDVSDLNSLTYAYLLLKDERPRVQWQIKHTSLGKTLSEYVARRPEELVLLDRLRSNHHQMKTLFDAVRAGVEGSRPVAENGSSPYDELNEGVTAQFMARAEMTSADAALLGRESTRRMDAVRRTSLILVLASAITLVLSAAGTAFLLMRGIGNSIRELGRGTQRIAAGDLEYRVAVAGADEISRLSIAFNDMAAKLSATYAQLEHKNQELQEFAFIASHDLSEPLRKIQTFGDLLKAKSANRLSEQERDYVSRMTGAANRMQELLDALLRYSRVDTKGQDFSPVKLHEVVRGATDDLEMAIRDVEAQVEIDPLPTVEGDPQQLRQLLQNLISNALKYHRSEVKPFVKIYGETDDGTGRIFVEDNGIGFDEKYVDKIFQPFQRLHGRNEYSGIGMGLAICRKIVERHKGTITAKSTPGKGSTFIVTLPVNGIKAVNNPR